MPRPGPLQDLPLEQFLPPNPNTPASSRPNKRPLDSPGAPILYSPAKRRILTDEGIFSPEKTMKSPLSHSTQDPFARFSQVLHGGESPAKKLDFGPSSQSQSSGSQSSVEQFTPRRSARLSKKHSSSPSPKSTQKTPPRSKKARASTRSSTGAPQQITVDPESIHYPGFIVHLDAQDEETMSNYDMDVDNWYDVDERELTKENIAPKRKAKKMVNAAEVMSKSVSTITDCKKGAIDKGNKLRTPPSTPKSIFGLDRLSGTTPRRSILRDSMMHTPRTRADRRKQLGMETETIAIQA